MGMTLLLRLCLSLVGLAGVSSAIGVPLALNAREKNYKMGSYSRGGGVAQVSLDKCEDSKKEGKDILDFGVQHSGKVCGTVESEREGLNNSAEYTSFFKDRGDEKDKNWDSSEHQDQGTKQCIDQGTSQGAIFGSGSSNGAQYLGLCGSSKVEETKFVKKVKEGKSGESKDKLTFGICTQNCWNLNVGEISGTVRNLQQEKTDNGNWKKVEFYKS